ncbi:MAG: hypothetical protein LBG97_01145 [Coriobacteriales bacterium]|jgi:hypothetical protein|nr:hypothetical protein [Coriobacteriales bacterium]
MSETMKSNACNYDADDVYNGGNVENANDVFNPAIANVAVAFGSGSGAGYDSVSCVADANADADAGGDAGADASADASADAGGDCDCDGGKSDASAVAPVSSICEDASANAVAQINDDSEIKPVEGFFLTSQRWH